jgi:ubiquinone/menaquinone biosynthesis C-methylase UbiE
MAVERLLMDSEEYIEMLFHWHRYLVAQTCLAGKRVADLACGEGYGADQIAQVAEQVTALDIDSATLSNARDRYRRDNLSFLRGNIDRIPLRDLSVDAVVSFETIEHVNRETQELFLSEIARILKPDGILLASTPDRARTEHFPEQNPYHPGELYQQEFRELLESQFERVHFAYQEVNLASVVWHDTKPLNSLATNYKLDWTHGAPVPTQKSFTTHLYVIAVCSRVPLDPSLLARLSSNCFEISRRPLEMIWRSGLTFEDRCKKQEEELSKRGQELTSLSRVRAAQEESIYSLQRTLTELERDLGRAREQVISLEMEVNRLRNLEAELNRIYATSTWHMIEMYRQLMDRSPLGPLFRPARDLVKRLLP